MKDSAVANLPLAHVIIYQAGGHQKYSSLIVRPSDAQWDTNASGILQLAVKVQSGEPLNLTIEMSKENYGTKREDFDYGKEFPAQVFQEFTLEPQAKQIEPEAGATTTIHVHVVRKDTGKGVEGASVVVLSFGGFFTKRFTGVTNADGDATVVIPLNNEFEIKASKELLGEAAVKHNTKDYPKQVGPVELTLEQPKGAVVSIHVSDSKTHNGIGDAVVVLDGPGFHSGTTNANGDASLVVPETGTFAVRITQQFYEAFSGGRVEVTPGDAKASGSFEMVAKAKKEEGKDTIEATVLTKDPADKNGKPKPLTGAEVKVIDTSAAGDAAAIRPGCR